MGTKYVSVPKKFDTVKWSALINSLCNMFDTIKEAAIIAQVSDTTLITWRDASYADGFEHPNMSNFIRICNLMDVDPSEFFTWE